MRIHIMDSLTYSPLTASRTYCFELSGFDWSGGGQITDRDLSLVTKIVEEKILTFKLFC